MKRSIWIAGFVACVYFVFYGGTALATPPTSAQSQFNVSASVAGSCTISATNIDFGNYNPSVPSYGTGVITYQCTPGLSPTIDLDAGLHAGGDPNSRSMSDGSGDHLNYNIYTDIEHTALWGDGSNGTTGENVTADGNSDTQVGYATAPSGQVSAAPNAYSDTVTATINW